MGPTHRKSTDYRCTVGLLARMNLVASFAPLFGVSSIIRSKKAACNISKTLEGGGGQIIEGMQYQ